MRVILLSCFYRMQALLGEPKFIENLQTFDKDNIPQGTIDKVRPYLELQEFDPDTVKKASKAAFGLCSWVRAVESYDRVARVVEPKQKRLQAAEVEVMGLLASLAEKQAQLAQVPLAAVSSALYC
jgi:dynein heavy chain, axonemal